MAFLLRVMRVGHVSYAVLQVCAELNIGIVAYSPLARNLLANTEGKVPTDWRASNPRFKAENFERNKSLALQITELGASKGASAAQLSLAWLYHRAAQLGVNVVPIPGTTKVIANLYSFTSASWLGW
jgi:aryl-alcohol dehydrogenase-like predicted oxidoreductase